MRREVLTDYLLERLGFIAPVELTPLARCLLILQTAEYVGHKLVRVVLHDWVKLFDNNVLDVINIYDL